jgi:hypothetical protein
MWNMLHMCYERPEKYISEGLRLLTEFRKYKM